MKNRVICKRQNWQESEICTPKRKGTCFRDRVERWEIKRNAWMMLTYFGGSRICHLSPSQICMNTSLCLSLKVSTPGVWCTINPCWIKLKCLRSYFLSQALSRKNLFNKTYALANRFYFCWLVHGHNLRCWYYYLLLGNSFLVGGKGVA